MEMNFGSKCIVPYFVQGSTLSAIATMRPTTCLRRYDFLTNIARTLTVFPVQLYTFTLCLDSRHQLLPLSHDLQKYSSIFIPDSIPTCLLVNISTVARSVPSQDVGSA